MSSKTRFECTVCRQVHTVDDDKFPIECAGCGTQFHRGNDGVSKITNGRRSGLTIVGTPPPKPERKPDPEPERKPDPEPERKPDPEPGASDGRC